MSVRAWSTTGRQRRSPVECRPLRLPGQSVDNRMSEIVQSFYEDLFVSSCLILLAIVDFYRWWTAARPSPIVFGSLAIIAVLYTWRKSVWLFPTIKNLRQGRDGERYVGQMLEELREKGYRIFHDIPGEGFNIDHVIVGPAGVFTIETKARSKPPTGRPTIEYDGNIIRLENGFGFDEPLKQARAQARWLTNLLNDGRGRLFRARPVVVFPDWYVERTGPRRKDDVWVLNPKALGTFLDYERAALSADRIDMASNTLAQRCRGPHHEET